MRQQATALRETLLIAAEAADAEDYQRAEDALLEALGEVRRHKGGGASE